MPSKCTVNVLRQARDELTKSESRFVVRTIEENLTIDCILRSGMCRFSAEHWGEFQECDEMKIFEAANILIDIRNGA